MRVRTLLLALALASPLAHAAQYSLALQPETTKISWTLGDVLHTVQGTFRLDHGTINFEPENGKALGAIVVDVASGSSGSEARDQRMHANVLESSKYLQSTFVPERFEGLLAIPGASRLKLYGTLTIHGAAHPITMDVQTTATADRMNATIAFDIPYVAWGMKDPSNFLLKVKKTVRMAIETNGKLQNR